MKETISQLNGVWIKVGISLFMGLFLVFVTAFVGYAVAIMGDRYTGTQARIHKERPYHEGAGRQLAVLNSQMSEIKREIVDLKIEIRELKKEIAEIINEASDGER